MKRGYLTLLVAAVAAPLVGCSGDSIQPGGVAVRDSAGVEIVVNESPLLTAADAWRLADSPSLAVGAGTDASQQLFRVQDAAILAGGELAIANAGTHEVRIHGPSGAMIRVMGREGEGPGEFSGLGRIWVLPGDTVLAWDGRTRRISVFDEHGLHVRTIPFPASVGDDPLRFPDGGFVGTTSVHDTFPRSMNESWWEDHTYLLISSDGDSLGVIGKLRGMEYMLTDWQGSDLRAQRPLGHVAATAAGPDAFYYGDSDGYRIWRFTRAGRLTRLIERNTEPRGVTASVRASYIAERLGAAAGPELRAAWNSYFARVSFPEELPAYRQLDVDPDGNLWVQAADVPGSEVTSWSVFSSGGRWITDLAGPRSRLLEAGSDYVVLLVRDDADVEHVMVYPIIKPTGSR